MNILDRIHAWSINTPNHLAYVRGESVLSYQDLEEKSNWLATYFSDSLPNDRAPIAIIGHKEPEMLITFLAAVKSGHPYIPIDTATPSQRIEAIIEKSKAALRLTPGNVQQLLVEQNLPAGHLSPQPKLPHEIKLEDAWYIIFTSGSTGEPKGVVITTACLESFVTWMLDEQHLSEQSEIFINQAPFSFDLSVMELYLSLSTGGTIFSLSRDEISEPKELFKTLASSSATVWVSTPSFAQMCLFEPTFSEKLLPRMRKFLFCGETLPPEVAASLLNRFPKAEVWNTYGPTEATCATTSLQITQNVIAKYNPLPVGYPKSDSDIRVMKADGSGCAESERGEIIIAGPNVSPGYLGQPELTAKAFFKLGELQAYRTGDTGHFEQGMLFFDGRQDNQIKLHGYRIELGDIESNLQALPTIRDAVVLPHLKNGLPDFLAAFIILNTGPVPGEFETTRGLKRELRKRLPDYMVPHKFYYPDKFPMTANGKIDRRKLAESMK